MKPVRHVDERGLVLVRDGLVLAFFCQANFARLAAGARAVFDDWLAAVPADSLKWSTVGASASEAKPLKPATLDSCKKLLDPDKPAKSFTAFTIFGPEEYNPSYQFDFSAKKDVEKSKALDAETNLVEMRFPCDFLKMKGADGFFDQAVRLGAKLPFDSGYASLALNWATEGALRESREILVPLALRHPGYDIHVNNSTRVGLGRRSRGARWLTYLGPVALKSLGGRERLAKQLDPLVKIRDAGEGVCLRAGAEPVPGDINRQDVLPMLASVAQAIEPVTWFGDMFVRGYLFDGDADKNEKWERRFFD